MWGNNRILWQSYLLNFNDNKSVIKFGTFVNIYDNRPAIVLRSVICIITATDMNIRHKDFRQHC